MKLRNLMGALVALAGIAVAPSAAFAKGDIMDIRCVDETGVMVFGTANQTDPFVCSPDHPLTIGDTLTIRVRMFVRNWKKTLSDASVNPPQTWTFKPGSLGGSALQPPKLSIRVGSRTEGAVFVDSILDEYGHLRESCKPLVWDEVGNPDANHTYYTDIYFQYKVKPGDLGMPITLETDADGFVLQNVDQTGAGQWMLVDTATDREPEVHFADFCFVPATEEPDGWPNCGTSIRKQHFRTTDLSDEGAFVKTLDFGPDDAEGTEWRDVYPGMDASPHADPEITLNGSVAADDNVTVYVWTEKEDVAVPVGGVSAEVYPGYTRQVLAVTVKKGESSAKFKLAGAEGAAVGADTTIYLCAVKRFPEAGTAVFENTTVQRTVKVVKAPEPTVRLYIDGTEATKTVTADPEYQAYKARLTFKVVPKVDVPVTVTFDAKVNGDDTLGSLDQIFDDNILRIANADFGGDPIEQKKTSVTISPETGTAEMNVYVLGTTSKVASKGVYFELKGVSSADSRVKVTDAGCTLKIKKGVPTIVSAEPMFTTEDGEGTITTVSGSDVDFVLEIADTYRNLYDEGTGYTFTWKSSDGEDIDPEDGIVMEDGVFTGSATFFNLGTRELSLQVKAPDGSQSAPVKYTLIVSDSKKTTIAFTDPNRLVFCEGEETTLKLGLTQPYKGTGYIFLDGDADKLAYVDSLLKTEGALIEQGKTEVASPRSIRFLDGTKDLTLKALLCSDETDKTKKVTTFVSGTLSFTVTNRAPVVTSVTAAGQYLDSARKGQTLPREVPMGVKKTFALTADDVPADLTNALFATKWVIEGQTYEVFGDPSTNVVTHTFLNATPAGMGGEEIRVYLKDKDMSDYPANPSFYFYVRVAAKPHLDLTTSAIGGTFNEDDTANASVTLTLSEPATAPILVKLTVQDTETGRFRLRTSEGSVTNAVDAAGNVQSNVYLVTIGEGVRVKNILAADMDGTNDTLAGLDLNAEVISEETTSEGVAWKDFFTASETVTIRVRNVPPAVIRPNDTEVAFTNMNASANTPYTISYGATDVKADLGYETNGVPVGLMVDISVDGVSVLATNVTSSAVQTTQVTFDGEGSHVVVISFTDKDQESTYRELNFYVQPSKRLKLSAHGPAPALGSSGGYSSHYAGAPGLGAGRVWAGETGPQKVANFIHSYSFTLATSAVDGWAYGYLANGLKDDGSLTPAPDKGIDSTGGWTKGQEITSDNAYDYTTQHPFGKLGYDNFVYGWACNNTESSKGSGDNATTATFVLNVARIGHMSIPLPKEEKDAKSYPEQSWEAIFAREFLTSDNCGDINLDGIPDLVLSRYGLGIIDPNTQTVVAESTEGDLKDVSMYNADENDNPRGYAGESQLGDFLPTTASGLNGYEAFGITGLGSWDEPFTAVLEIRGVGETPNGAMPLNDALAPEFPDGTINRLAFAEVESDVCYLDPNTNPTSTLSRVEFLAWQEFAAAHGIADPDDPASWRKDGRLVWSPERPTLPTKIDTDGDGFPDGYEYYYWYRAHVGYMDGNVHRRLTGRKYDERNPGEGTFITSEEIEVAMDPIVKSGDLEQDTDNDGLPDILEMIIGTNPFDFDTDGDGLPDGWELCNVGNLDPLDPASHLDGKSDTVRNSDGDAMAISSYALEKTQKPVPAEIEHAKRTTFAVIDPSGDTDGVQWYAVKGAPADVAVEAVTNAASVWSFTSEGRTFIYASPVKPPLTADGRLGRTLEKYVTFVSKTPDMIITPIEDPEPDGPTETTNYVAAALYPVRLEAGVPVRMLFDEAIGVVVTTLAADIAEKDANACWIYGKGPENARYGDVAKTAADYGCLALGRQLAAKKGAIVCAMPSDERDVAFLHYLVYQEFGFDPRTAWKAKDPLATRWSKSIDGESVEGITVIQQGGYTGAPSRTRDYANYDEFLVYSFFVNNGCDMSGTTSVIDKDAPALIRIWDAFTTNPQGPNEKLPPTTEGGTGGETAVTVKSYGRGTNGADTDFDGVPDGWELYVMSGPKKNGAYVFAHPYAGFATGLNPAEEMKESYFSPFLDFAKGTETSNQIYLGGQANDDTLNEFHEFEGTDSIAYYAVAEKEGEDPLSTTVAHDVTRDGEWTWFNKFFPTDPWNVDTDGDSVKDNAEKGAFAYGTPADDGKLWSIPGGGLNPCSIDTDLDGIPDPWENQYKGKTVYAGDNPAPFYAKGADGNEIGNPLEGLTDGMDGTVPDAYNVVNGSNGSASGQTTWTVITPDGRRWSGHVNRDYDRDGLENWQEYLTGTMRCWRYDDPYSPWTAIPREMYYTYDAKTAKWAWDPKYEKLGCNKDNPDEFWYKTLVDRESGIYNPHLVVDTVCGQYFSKVTNAWDAAYLDSTLSGGKRDGAWYFLYDRIGPDMIKDIWVGNVLNPKRLFGIAKSPGTAPAKYMGCSPLEYDSDKDGMDDYYELFHGMNPILGESGANLASEGPCDLVFDAWRGGESGVDGQFEAWGDSTTANWWQRNPKKGLPNGGKSRSLVPGGYDFEVYPWLNGLQMADPDGDDMRNGAEAIMPRFADDAWHHTDPTPLWMTDSSYADSIVRRFFCLPTRFDAVSTANASFFGDDGTEYFFRDLSAGWVADTSGNFFLPFVPDFWDLSASGAYNWMYSFEENEGFDTDHDGTGDTEEASSRTRAATDPQDFDSPRRRQAMYFAGAEWPSVLQTMPEETERYPVATEAYPDDASFRQYTVECWVKPDAPEGAEFPDMTILERAIWTGLSNPGDEEFMRKNFQLGIKNNKWYTKYDPDGTLKKTVVETFSTGNASTGWHHLAATYDGVQLVLYVDGTAQTPMKSSLAPECGMSALVLHRNWGIGLHPGDYWFDREYAYKAFIIGARAKGRTELPAAVRETGYTTLDLAHGVDFSRYDGFFKGYVDEISVWDGARSFDDIYADYSQRIRLDRTAAIENRSAFYKKWSVGGRRYAADLSGTSSSLVPELRYHWSFDALFGAENPGQVAIEPHGFSAAGKPILSRPKDYVVSWWSQVVGDSDSVYAGNLDWVPWIHNTVAHLPRFDTTTLDSMFWSENFCGATNGTYVFPRTAEPVSRWTQFAYNGVNRSSRYQTTAARHHLVFEQGWSPSNTTTLVTQFEFTGRHLNQIGDDLLPLGGAFVKYVDTMWDDQGASSMWEQTGEDSTANGLPDWWEEYADQNYRPKGMDPGSEIDWNTELVRDGIRMTAGEAYLRDLAAGMYVDADGAVHPTESDRAAGILKTPFEQTAKSDGLIPDWWKSLYKIDGEGPLVDNDNDGLDNYVEYMASELLPFGLRLNPLMPRTDTVTLDYFRKVGKLYIGEMLTDHDQMEDSWERSLNNAAIADATLWDALKDVDGDGWNNFAENRYNEYKMSTLAQHASHAVGDAEVLDAPIPSVTLTVRYNGSNLGAAKDAAGGGKSGENADNKEASKLPNLVVRAYTKTGGKPDAEYVLAPGQTVDREVYIGGWEDRVVRGTMSPGNIDIGSVNIKFAQIPQADTYSWTDENGRHLAGTYAEFKEAFDRNPDIIQNIQDFTWLELVAPVNQYTSSDKAVTVSREKLTQTGYIAVYGERVGTVDLTTGEFEFDLAAMNNLRVNYTYDGGKGPEAAWSYKEAIFKITYSATVPAVQADRFQVTLAKADTGFMKGGKNSFTAFFDNDGNGEYTPGEPFGVLNDVEIGWSGRTLELELTDMSAVTPRIDLWEDASDRVARWGDFGTGSNRVVTTVPQADLARVRVVRYQVDDMPVNTIGVQPRVLLDRTFDRTATTLLHEGDFLRDGELDIDWSYLVDDLSHLNIEDQMLTNVDYLVVIGDGATGYDFNSSGKEDTNTVITALSTIITRRFERSRSKPVPHLERCVFTKARPTFAWTLPNEDTWASAFGTTYTAFKIVVKSGETKVYESPITRMPAKNSDGIYTWAPPLYVDALSPSNPSVVFANLSDYTWQVYIYNAKFNWDGNPSDAQTFRMNVTHQDLSSCSIAVAVSYAGPATQLADRIRVQAFESPDFTGDPVAEKTVGTADQVVVLDGLAEGDYFIRAYIDTNGNGVHDEWESWGYLCERDLANKTDIFNPVIARSRFNADEGNVRTVHIEDCDTDGDWFPDAWEAEQNGNVFERFKSGKGQGPVNGDSELPGVNTNLDANLTKAMKVAEQMTRALKSVSGVSLMTGLAPQNVVVKDNGFEVESEVKSETLTIVDFAVDAAQNRVLLKVGAETTADVDSTVANFLNITVRKGAEVTVRVECAESLNGPWEIVPGVDGKVTVDKAGTDIEVKLNGELPAQGYFRAVIEE